MDINVCGKQYSAAITEFSRTAKDCNMLRKIFFVERKKSKYQKLVDIFNQYFPASTEEMFLLPSQKMTQNHTVFNDEEKKNTTSITEQKNDFESACDNVPGRRLEHSSEVLDESLLLGMSGEYDSNASIPDQDHSQVFRVGNCILGIIEEDIRNVTFDAIVCPEIACLPNGGPLASAIKFMARKDFQEEKLVKIQKKKCITTTECKNSLCTMKYILHVSVPVWSGDGDTIALQATMESIFDKFQSPNVLKRRKIHSVAIPLLGIGEKNVNRIT